MIPRSFASSFLSSSPNFFMGSFIQLRKFCHVSKPFEASKAFELSVDALPTQLVSDRKVDFAVLSPQDHSKTKDPLPLILRLHGGGGSHNDLVQAHEKGDHFDAVEDLPCVIVTPSVGLSFYNDYFDKSNLWHTFLIKEFIPFIQDTYNCGGKQELQYLIGASMGGYGSLQLAFRHPEQFGAVAALEPGIDAALEPSDLTSRNMIMAMWEGETDENREKNDMWKQFERMFGGIIPNYDVEHYKTCNPCSVANDNAKALRNSGLEIFIECGDQDFLNLHDGTEFLHRILWDKKIEHEYHLYHGADHIGSSLIPRYLVAFNWLADVIKEKNNPPVEVVLDEEEKKYLQWLVKDGPTSGKEMQGKPIDLTSDKSLALIDVFLNKKQKKILGQPTDGPLLIRDHKWRSETD